MLINREQDLINARNEQLLRLLEDNKDFKTKFDEASDARKFQIQFLNDKLEELRNSSPYENFSGAEAILELLKLLTDRYFDDIHMWTESFKIDAKWLIENLHKCDSVHTYLWWEMNQQSKDYCCLLFTMHSRFQKLISMVGYIMALLSL